MSQVKSITINNVTYNVAQASANDQKRLLLIVGAYMASNIAQSSAKDVNDDLLIGSLMRFSEDKFDEIAQITLAQCVISGQKDVVSIKDFQGKIVDYFKLIAKCIHWNLDDFFIWILSDQNDDKTTTSNA